MEQAAARPGVAEGHCGRHKREIHRSTENPNRAGFKVNFTILDVLVIAIVVFSVVMSTMKGLIREVLGLATIFAAIFISAWTYRPASNLFKDVVRTENLALFLGFSIVFVGTLL